MLVGTEFKRIVYCSKQGSEILRGVREGK